MSTVFTYPSLRCIMEFLEPNKRIRIASRSQPLRQAEKSIPLHLNHLRIEDRELSIDGVFYDTAGASAHMDTQEAARKLVEALVGYNRIYAKKVIFYISDSDHLPLNHQIITNDVRTNRVQDIDSMLDPSCLPLKMLTVFRFRGHCWEVPIVEGAVFLTIKGWWNSRFTVETLVNFKNKKVCLRGTWLPVEDILNFIDSWLTNEKELGSSFILEVSDVFHILQLAFMRFGGESLFDTAGRLLHCVSIPMWGTTTNLNIYDVFDKIEIVVEAKEGPRISRLSGNNLNRN